MIDFYDFGRMVVSGREYKSDLIILPKRIISPWWRQEGHRLGLQDLEAVFADKPKHLLVGTGYIGLMKVAEEVKTYARTHNILLKIAKTGDAVNAFNQLPDKTEAVGAFHLTC